MTPEELLRIDAEAVSVARGHGPLELAIGRALAALFDGDRLAELGCSCRRDYIREHVGLPPRSVYAMIRLARGVADRPVLARAIRTGEVSPRKAGIVLDVARGAAEGYWVGRATKLTCVDLERAVREAGGAIPEEDAGEVVVFSMTPEQQDRLDRAMELARLTEGFATPDWRRREAIAQEWLGKCAEWIPDEPEPPAPPRLGEIAAGVDRHLHVLEEAFELVDDEEPLPVDPLALHYLVQRLLKAWREHDAALGAVAWRVRTSGVDRFLGYRTREEYVRERMNLSGPCFRRRVWLEERMQDLPALRRALVSGRLTYSKALLVAADATPHDVEERIGRAEKTTCQQVERDHREKDDRSQRAQGVRRVWAPREASATVALAIATARAWSKRVRGIEIDEGEALAVIADHFVEAHGYLWGLGSRDDWKILLRHGWCCGVPGCSRPPQHIHHIRFRSHGGTNELFNRLALCAFHHLRGVHRSRIIVVGRAGERLTWTFLTRFGETLAVYVTEGDDDVTRVA